MLGICIFSAAPDINAHIGDDTNRGGKDICRKYGINEVLRNAYVSRSQGFFCYLVPIGYLSVVVCSTMPNRTCVGRKTGVPIDYGLLEHTIMLDLSHFYKFFPKNGKIR